MQVSMAHMLGDVVWGVLCGTLVPPTPPAHHKVSGVLPPLHTLTLGTANQHQS